MSSNRFLAGELDISPELVQSTLTLSTEAIQFQRESPLFKELTAEMAKLNQDSPVSDWYRSHILAIIKKHTGISMTLEVIEKCFFAGIITPDLTAQNIFSQSDYEDSVGRDGMAILKSKLEKEGGVDLKNSRVTGIYSKLVVPLLLGTDICHRAHFTPEMSASMILHEIGHFFTTVEYAAEIRSINVVTQVVLSEVTKTNDDVVKHEIVEAGLKQLGVTVSTNEVASLTKMADDPKTFTVAVYTAKINRSSATGTGLYDHKSCEAAADQFAARHGAAEHLAKVMALTADEESTYGKTRFVFNSIMKYTFTLLLTPVAIFVPLVGFIQLFMLCTWLCRVSGYGDQGVYDTDKDRIARLRREIIAGMKEPDLPPTLRREFERALAKVEKDEALLHNHEAFSKKVYLLFSKAGRTQKARMTMHQVLEELANNKLFSSANSLFSRAE